MQRRSLATGCRRTKTRRSKRGCRSGMAADRGAAFDGATAEVGDADHLTLGQLAAVFFQIGALAFGGGGSTLSMMHREFCVRRRVLPDEEFQLLFSLSRLVPGINLLSLTVLLGHRAHGLVGALVSL